MLETALNFEQTASQLEAIALISPGLAYVIIGLFVWLGGLRLGKFLAAIAGAIAGGICGYFATDKNIILAVLLALAAAGIATTLAKISAMRSLFWQLTSALCCSALGVVLIFAGMILLLLYKGAMPVSWINQRVPFCVIASVIMTAFGTIEQLVICRWEKDKRIEKKEVLENNQESKWQKPNWRTE